MGEKLNHIAYKDITWQMIAEDIKAYEKLSTYEYESDKAKQLESRLEDHALMFYHRGFDSLSEAIGALPKDFKLVIADAAAEFRKAILRYREENKINWPALNYEQKVSVINEIVGLVNLDKLVNKEDKPTLDLPQFMKDWGLTGRAKVIFRYSGDADHAHSLGFKIGMPNWALDQTFKDAMSTAGHEFWHYVAKETKLTNRISTETEVLRHLEQIAIKEPEDSKMYYLGTHELSARAFETFFKHDIGTGKGSRDR